MFRLRNRIFILSVFTVILSFTVHLTFAQHRHPDFERDPYYAALSSDDMAAVEKQLSVINSGKRGQEMAFEGALQMKKAALLKGAANKLKEFKAGRGKLEKMIAEDPGNIEFRFLRLIIQEKAPKMLHYDQQIEEDHHLIIASFVTMPKGLQKVVREYSRSSKILSPDDF